MLLWWNIVIVKVWLSLGTITTWSEWGKWGLPSYHWIGVVSGQQAIMSSVFTLLLALLSVSLGNIWLCSGKMLQHAHQLLSNCVWLLVGSGQVAHTGFLELFHWKQLPAAAQNDTVRAMGENQNNKVEGWTAKQWAEIHMKLHKAADPGDNSLWVYHSDSRHIVFWYTVVL